jgi:hypothetical protein
MPASEARSAVLMGASMRPTSHHANYWSSPDLHIVPNEASRRRPYGANMPRKSAKSDGVRPEQPDWYLPQWMRTLKVTQADLARDCGWTPSTMHGIYHGRTSYYRDIVNLVAGKLRIQPYELLMHPEQAMAYRRFRASAQEVATLVDDSEERRKAG